FFDGYASNIPRCVNVDGGKFAGLKSHDYHMNKLKSSNSPTYNAELYNLVFGPIRAELFSGCYVNNVKFWGLHEMTSCVRKIAVSMSRWRGKYGH
ncbi:hypothetical protein Prudu_005312, partial [Prunus dulcis]